MPFWKVNVMEKNIPKKGDSAEWRTFVNLNRRVRYVLILFLITLLRFSSS